MKKRHWLVRISVVGFLLLSFLAFRAYGDKVNDLQTAQRQLAFITGKKAVKTCESAKTNKQLWSLVAASSDESAELKAAVAAYAKTPSPSCLKVPR